MALRPGPRTAVLPSGRRRLVSPLSDAWYGWSSLAGTELEVNSCVLLVHATRAVGVGDGGDAVGSSLRACKREQMGACG